MIITKASLTSIKQILNLLFVLLINIFLLNNFAFSQSKDIKTEIAFWNSIKESFDIEEFENYIKKYPNGQFVELAWNKIKYISKQSKTQQEKNIEISQIYGKIFINLRLTGNKNWGWWTLKNKGYSDKLEMALLISIDNTKFDNILEKIKNNNFKNIKLITGTIEEENKVFASTFDVYWLDGLRYMPNEKQVELSVPIGNHTVSIFKVIRHYLINDNKWTIHNYGTSDSNQFDTLEVLVEKESNKSIECELFTDFVTQRGPLGGFKMALGVNKIKLR